MMGMKYENSDTNVNSCASSLMMEAVRTSETSVDNHFTRQYIPEDNSEQLCITFASKSHRTAQVGEQFVSMYDRLPCSHCTDRHC
jgi:hypothetical protein